MTGDLEELDLRSGNHQVWLKFKGHHNRVCLLIESDTIISINNEPVSLGKFLETAVKHELTGTINPLVQRYGAALTAEFMIKDK